MSSTPPPPPASPPNHSRRTTALLATSRRESLSRFRYERMTDLIERYPAVVASSGLKVDLAPPNPADPACFVHTHAVPFSYRGVSVTIDATTTAPFTSLDLDDAALDAPDAAAAFLERLVTTLAAEAEETGAAAREELQSLVDVVLLPTHTPWIGGELAAREQYLDLPDELTAADAVLLAERRRKGVQGDAAKAKLAEAGARLRQLPDAKLTGRSLKSRYRETFPFLTGALHLDLAAERALAGGEVEQLLTVRTADLAATVDRLLAAPRAALFGRIGEQVSTLVRQIQRLPHIELLPVPEIIRTVAPYYSTLDKALKKRRAKSALVAVEERAREAKYLDDVQKLAAHKEQYADVARYYPLARSLGRKLVLYVGPTNSGKTWRALNDLAAGESGAYLAPLRLLALEGQEELEKRGRATSFLTGEERDLREGARFVSSTIEMLGYDNAVDGVVVDEVQLLGDERRGWAWLAAVVGAPAKKVIMTGSPDCVEMVKWLAAHLGEELEIHTLERFNELRVGENPIRLRDISPGTAIVCFSRRDVLRIKETIEANSSHRVAVVYGNLSPQVRREEARRFRMGEADVLVATDAIAMGLNLPIAEVLFYATEKFDGESVRELTPSEIRQIAGRAGRYGFAQFGLASALSAHSLSLVRAALSAPIVMQEPLFYVAPGPSHVRIIGQVLNTDSLERILTFFGRAMEFSDERFDRANIDELSFLATYVDAALPHMPPEERLGIAAAPVDLKSDTVLGWFLERMLPAFRADPSAPQPLHDLFAEADAFAHDAASSQMELRRAEDYLKTLTVYAWLAYRYPLVFPDLEIGQARREEVNSFVERSLRRAVVRRCQVCEKRLEEGQTHKVCDACHAKLKTKGHHRRRRG